MNDSDTSADRIARFMTAWRNRLGHDPAADLVVHRAYPKAGTGMVADLTAADIDAILAERDRLAAEVEQLQVELGAALAPDEDPEPMTLRDVDPDAFYATEDDDYDDERAEAHTPGGYSQEAPF